MVTRRLFRYSGLLLLISTLAFLIMPATARADGGAPNLAYIAGAKDGISVIDVAQQKMVNTIKAPGEPGMILLSLDGRFLYVTQPDLGQISLISAKTGNTVCSAKVPGHPNLLAFDANTKLIFAAANDADTVTAIDVHADDCAIKGTFQIGGPVYGLGVAFLGSSSSADSGNQLWVSTTDAILIFDDIHGQQIARIDMPQGPRYISTPAGTAAYVATQQNSIIAIDFNTHKTLEVLSGGTYGPMDYDATTGKIYVPDKNAKQLAVINPVNTQFQPPTSEPEPIKLEANPVSVAITSDGQLGFVALEDGNVAMFDIPGRSLITTIKVGGTPRFIITGIYPPALGDTPAQAMTLQTVVTIAAYVVVAALLIVPIILFRRYSKARAEEAKLAGLDEEEEENEDLAELEAKTVISPERKSEERKK